jgi:hypothetical protein
MNSIAAISLEQLLTDRAESEADIRTCHFALACGVTHHKDGLPVQERIDGNQRIIAVIDAELERRTAANTSD